MIWQAWSYIEGVLEEVHLIVNIIATAACFMTLARILSSLIKIDREARRIGSLPDKHITGRSSFENIKRASVALKGALFAALLFSGGMGHWIYAGLPKIVSSQQSTMWGLAVISAMLVMHQLAGIFVDMFRSEGSSRSEGGTRKEKRGV